MHNIIKNIVDDLALNEDSIDKKVCDDNGRIWIIEGINKYDGNQEKYLIYDCSKKDYTFDIDTYGSYMDDLEGTVIPIIAFQSWEEEQKQKELIISELNKTKKSKLNKYFKQKQPFYTDLSDIVELNVEKNGINYLEYLPDEIIDSLEGRVYNVSFKELKKIFNVTGTNLFKKNVRFGLEKSSTGSKIRNEFKSYIKTGAYFDWIKTRPQDEFSTDIMSVFSVHEKSKLHKPSLFWFYHNGITIFCYGDSSIDFSGLTIKLNPKDISVINGAQTMTNFYEGFLELEKEFIDECVNSFDEKESNKLIKFFKEYLKDVSEKIIVKTIFINGNEEFVRPVTYGLNTQIPILESDIIANSENVDKINSALKYHNMKIIKGGEIYTGTGYTVLDFVKKYLIIKQKPGESKNLNRSKLNNCIQDILKEIETYPEEIINSLENIEYIDSWWVSKKTELDRLIEDDFERYYFSNGKNYFQSFVLHEMEYSLDEEYLLNLFNKYIKTFTTIHPKPDIKVFKSDALYNKYIKTTNINDNSLHIDDKKLLNKDDCIKLQEYLNNHNDSNYTVQNAINRYLNTINIDMPKFRVISKTDNTINESYPFPNSTFSEIYQRKIYDTEFDKIRFEDTSFYKELIKEFPIFVITWNENRIAQNIEFIPNFSFKDYINDAKTVYFKTINAFYEGDVKQLPKMSEKLHFHVRPKAVNSADSFEFTNGEYITKRTFWANKDTIKEIINKYSNEV